MAAVTSIALLMVVVAVLTAAGYAAYLTLGVGLMAHEFGPQTYSNVDTRSLRKALAARRTRTGGTAKRPRRHKPSKEL
jgi:hypothetical protein